MRYGLIQFAIRRVFGLSMVFALASMGVAWAQLANENLLVEVPPGYKIDFQEHKPNSLMNEMVPTSETVNDWTEMVTVQIFYNLKTTPDAFVSKMASGWIAACPGAKSDPVVSGPENGYPAGVWLLNCPKNPATGKPEITWVKTMQGNDSFYAEGIQIHAVERPNRAVDEISALGRSVRFTPRRARVSANQELGTCTTPPSWPGLSRPPTSSVLPPTKTWMPATSAGMTNRAAAA
jgi:hypothetical protein